MPFMAKAKNLKAIFLIPFNLAKAISIDVDIFVFAKDL